MVRVVAGEVAVGLEADDRVLAVKEELFVVAHLLGLNFNEPRAGM